MKFTEQAKKSWGKWLMAVGTMIFMIAVTVPVFAISWWYIKWCFNAL